MTEPSLTEVNNRFVLLQIQNILIKIEFELEYVWIYWAYKAIIGARIIEKMVFWCLLVERYVWANVLGLSGQTNHITLV